MTTQPIPPLVPGVAAAATRATTDDEDRLTTADADDATLGEPSDVLSPDVGDTTSTDQGVPVGEADLDADRRRTGADETRGDGPPGRDRAPGGGRSASTVRPS
jgi:hypothetical protein